jgi:hypothetical protein
MYLDRSHAYLPIYGREHEGIDVSKYAVGITSREMASLSCGA